MSHNEIATPQIQDLTDYEKELLHLPGSIQPHGILFVLKEPELEILQVSDNTFKFLGLHPQELLNKQLQDLIDIKQINLIEQCLLQDFESINPLKVVIKNRDNQLKFDGIIKRCKKRLIFDKQPRRSEETGDFFSFYHLVKKSIAKIQNAASLRDMCQIIVKEVQNLTGFDRVMIYQFGSEQTGKVIAEEKLETLSPYLNLHALS